MPNCLDCPSEEIYAKERCRRCYNRQYQKDKRQGFMCGHFVGAAKFAKCHPKTRHYARGLCRKCYFVEFQKEKKREYDAQRYKDRKLNKMEPKVQEHVAHIPSPAFALSPRPRKQYPPGTFATPEDEEAFYAWLEGKDELSSIKGEM